MAMVKRVFREKYTLQATINLQFEYMKTNLNLHRLICIMSPKLGQCMKGWQTIGDIWNVVLLTLNKNYLDWKNTRWASVGKCNGSKQRISEDNTKENTGIAWTHVITRGWILKKKPSYCILKSKIFKQRGWCRKRLTFIKQAWEDLSMRTYMELTRAARDRHHRMWCIRVLHDHPCG